MAKKEKELEHIKLNNKRLNLDALNIMQYLLTIAYSPNLKKSAVINFKT